MIEAMIILVKFPSPDTFQFFSLGNTGPTLRMDARNGASNLQRAIEPTGFLRCSSAARPVRRASGSGSRGPEFARARPPNSTRRLSICAYRWRSAGAFFCGGGAFVCQASPHATTWRRPECFMQAHQLFNTMISAFIRIGCPR
jgi:hypothetical protein